MVFAMNNESEEICTFLNGNIQLCVSEVETSLNLLDKVNTDINKTIDSTHEHK